MSAWDAVVDRMLAEIRQGSPRGDAYWAQQLAFGPVLVHAIALRLRRAPVSDDDLPHLRRVVGLAARAFGQLPEGGQGDPRRLVVLARRQATALIVGRRTLLRRMAERLQAPVEPNTEVPPTFLRTYELLGWRPERHARG